MGVFKLLEPSSNIIGGKPAHGSNLTFVQCLLNTSTSLDNWHTLYYLILITSLISESQLALLLAKQHWENNVLTSQRLFIHLWTTVPYYRFGVNQVRS